jgi:DNA-binding MarR family transcriptional regulator
MRIEHEQIQALAGFRNALRRFLAFSEEATRAQGVTPQQYQAMLAIKAQPQGTMGVRELSGELLLKANSTVQLVDRLARMGLVRRQDSDTDRRMVRVVLTEAGNAVLLRLAALHLEQLGKRKKQLADILRQVKNM